MSNSRSQLREILDDLDRLVYLCAREAISFAEFLELYGYPVGQHALDGHDASIEERNLLGEFSKRIGLHIRVQDRVLHRICSANDADNVEYIDAGRISPVEAYEVFKRIVREHGA